MAILGELGMTALGQGLQSINSQRQQDYNKETMALQFGYNSMMQQQGQNNRRKNAPCNTIWRTDRRYSTNQFGQLYINR